MNTTVFRQLMRIGSGVLLGVALFALAGLNRAQAQISLVATGATWNYLGNGSDPGAGWQAPGFNDSTWNNGVGQFGYGEADEATVLPTGFASYYFRHVFSVADKSGMTNLHVRLLRDDGAIVYLNGTEVFRSSITNASVDYLTFTGFAVSDDGKVFQITNVSPSLLVNGQNTIAVEVHQSDVASSDVTFDLAVVANPFPEVAITSPTNTQVIVGTTVPIAGTATPGGPGIQKVEIFANTTKLGEVTNSAWTFNWLNATPGTYSLTAKITDISGLLATSAPVSVTVQATPAGLLIARGSVWKYNDLNVDLGTSWRDTNYDDTTWGSGTAPLGAGDPHIVTTINHGPTGARYPTVYYRKSFTIGSASSYQGMTFRLLRDDGALVYLNGTLVVADGANTNGLHTEMATQTVDGANESTFFTSTYSGAALRDGVNVIAVASKQVSATSSDLGFDLEVEAVIDTNAPTVINTEPVPSALLLELGFITVTFSEPVEGVNATDLLINGDAATNVIVINPKEYTFQFATPATGTVQVAWAPGHGITDAVPLHNAFAGGNWTYQYDPNASTSPNIIISEFLTDNGIGIRDEDGSREDWIEIYNAGVVEVNLGGWFLTDTNANLTKWRFPGVVIQPNQYLLVWASAKDKTNAFAPLHTNFKLNKAGGYLALVSPLPQTNIVSVFTNYPAQQTDITYGRDRVDPNLIGYYITPTPGAQNTTSGPGFAVQPGVSVASGIYTNASIIVTVTNPPFTIVRYTVDGSVPTNTSPIYSGAFTFSTNTFLKLRAYVTNNPSLFPSPVVMRHYVFLDDTTKNFSSRLPIVLMSTMGRTIPSSVAPGQPRQKGTLAVIDLHGARASFTGTPDYFGAAEFEIFGQTSEGFPKKPHNIEVQDELGNDTEVSLLGMPADADWKMRNPYSDKPMLMDFLAFELFEDMGNYSVRRRFVEVFNDLGGGKVSYPGDYYGVLCFVEKIEQGGDRVDIAKLAPTHTNEPSISGGYMFKKDKDSVGDLNFNTAGGGGFSSQLLKVHEPKPREITTAQLNWLRNYLNLMEQSMYSANWLTATGTNHYTNYLDPDGFVEQFWIVEFPKQIDGYRLSDYFQKDRGGRVKPEPIWDWNLSFGNANYAGGGYTNGWYYAAQGENAHIWARRLINGTTSGTGTSGDPDFCQKVADRWTVLRTNVMNGNRVMARIDELAELLDEAAVRDFAKFPRFGYIWPNPDGGNNGDAAGVGQRAWDVDYQNPNNYPALIAQMKKWVNGRYLWIDSQFARPATISLADGMVTNGTQVTMSSPDGGAIYYSLDGTDPRAKGGGIAPGALTYSGPITINANARLTARVLRPGAWQNTWSGPAARTYYTMTPSLRITEIMYNPAPPPAGSTNSAEDFAYIEVRNVGGTSLNVGGYQIRGGVSSTFSNVTLVAGESAVVVKNVAAFQSRYGTSIKIVGVYTGDLSDDSNRLILEGALREPINDISYNDSWNKITDGFGFSFVVINDNAPLNTYSGQSNWRPSRNLNGSPGAADPAPLALAPIRVSEIVSRAAAGGPDVIELYNPTANPVNITGWFLTDDFGTPRKFVIPSTTINGNSFATFTESQFNAGTNAFGLGAKGDDIYLFAADGVNLLGYVHGFTFNDSPLGGSFGRYTNTLGDEHFVVQSAPTIGNPNSGPTIGPIVITEIMYRPGDIVIGTNGYNNVDDEYVEIQNISGAPVALYDAPRPTNSWRLRGSAEFDFPPNAPALAAGAYAMLVSFDPVANPSLLASFRSKFSVSPSIPVYGPYSGSLNNGQARVTLRRFDVPDPVTTEVIFYDVDTVEYTDVAPWPVSADGLGLSLQRRVHTAYGNDANNWAAAAPSPGAAFAGGTAPQITSQPTNQLIVAGSSVTFAATATGVGVRYQWRYQGINLEGATNPILTYTNFLLGQAGVYNILAYNAAGSVLGQDFTVTTRIGLRILQQPISRTVVVGRTTNFTISATGAGTIRYQWNKNGSPISSVSNPTATNATITFTNVQFADQGVYTVMVTDDYESTLSDPATLNVVTLPVITLHPISQTVVEGQGVSFSVSATGSLPISFRWRRGGFTYTNNPVPVFTVTESNSVLTIPHVYLTNFPTINNSNRIDVAVTNAAGSAGLSAPAFITILADTDGDGLPDSWETGRPGFSTTDAADGARDDDGDGMNNGDEYVAGTDPFNNASVLKVSNANPGVSLVAFTAMSNHVYSVEYSDSLSQGGWQRLTTILATSTNRPIVVQDTNAVPNRFYRIGTPVF